MRIGSLFSGYGGLDLGVQAVLGGTVAWHCDNDPGASKILAHRWPDVPNLGDITAVDWARIEPVDVITAGYPCQPDSDAGQKRSTDDTRFLWPEVARAVRALGPRLIVLENVRGHLRRSFPGVVGSLADLGYDAEWTCLRASDIGAPHRRERVFVVAYPASHGRDEGWTESARLLRRQDVAECSHGSSPDASIDGSPRFADRAGSSPPRGGGERHPSRDDRISPAPDAERGGRQGRSGKLRSSGRDEPTDGRSLPVRWGKYELAIKRWERLTRPAPAPTEPGSKGQPRLSPRFVEWMQGLPAGHVTDVPGLSRNDQLKALGNGVVPAQAAAAVAQLLDHLARAA